MSKTLSTVRKLMAEYKMGFVVGDKDVDAHYDAFEAQLRTLVEKFAEELIGEDKDQLSQSTLEDESRCRFYRYGGYNSAKHEQRQNAPKLLDQMFGGEDE